MLTTFQRHHYQYRSEIFVMDATPEQSAEGLAVVQVLSAVLDRLVLANGPIAHADPGQITKFHAMKAPGIGIQQYLERYVGFVCS